MTLKNKIILSAVLCYQAFNGKPDRDTWFYLKEELSIVEKALTELNIDSLETHVPLHRNSWDKSNDTTVIVKRVEDIPKLISALQNQVNHEDLKGLKCYPALGHKAPDPDEKVIYQAYQEIRVDYARNIEDPIIWYTYTKDLIV